MDDFVPGKQEAIAFKNKEFSRMYSSTLRKVEGIETILGKTLENTLKTDVKWYQNINITIQEKYESAKEHWLGSLILLVIGAVIGAIISKCFNG